MDDFKDQLLLVFGCLVVGLLLSVVVRRIKKSKRVSSKIGGEFLIIFFLENLFVGASLSLGLILAYRDSHGLSNTLIEPGLYTLLSASVLSIDFQHLKATRRKLEMSRVLLALIILMRGIPSLEESLKSVKINAFAIQTDLWQVFNIISASVLFFWLASLLIKGLDFVIMRRRNIASSIKVLLFKVVRIGIYFSVFLWILHLSGISLSSFAFISGALVLGIGFGLQKIISNFVSGLIILAEGSVQPGHVLEVDGVVGVVKSVNTRYVSIIMRDNKELLVPNEEFVINQTCNWSYSDTNSRITLPVGVSYDSDVNQVRELCLEAVAKVPRVLETPEADCLITGFGDSSVDFSVRFWIKDPEAGVANVKSDVYFEIWNIFKQHGIEIPFPQRVVTMKSVPSSVES